MFIAYKTKAKLEMSSASPTPYLVTLIYMAVPYLLNRLVAGIIRTPWGLSIYNAQDYFDYLTRLSPSQVSYMGTSSLLIGLVVSLLGYGYTFYCLKVSRGQPGDYNDLFAGFYRPGRIILADIMIFVRVFLWSLLFVIPGIVAGFSYSQTYRILADDPDISVNEAINLSRDMMRGHRLEYFFLILSFFGWWLLESLSFGILGIYVTPYMTCTQSVFYDEVSAPFTYNRWENNWMQ